MDAIDLPKLKKLIRSLLISCPRGMPARDLAADFRNTMGRPLPFQNFGYRSLDEFIRTIPDVVRVSPGPNGEKFYYGVATAETQHVARLVATQKKPPAHRCAKPSACVRPTGFTKKGLAGPRGRYSAGPGKRGKPMKEELNVPAIHQSNFNRSSNPPPPFQLQRGSYRPPVSTNQWRPPGFNPHPIPHPLSPHFPPSSHHATPNHHLHTLTRSNTYPIPACTSHFTFCASPPPRPLFPPTHPTVTTFASRHAPPIPLSYHSQTPPTSSSWLSYHADAPPTLSSWLSVAPPPGFAPSLAPHLTCPAPRPSVAPPPGYSPITPRRPPHTTLAAPPYPPLTHTFTAPTLPLYPQNAPPTTTHTSHSFHFHDTPLTISRSNSTPIPHLLPHNSPEPARTAALLPAGGERSSDVPPALKGKQPSAARPDVAVIKQLSPKGSQNAKLSDMVRQLLEEKPNGVWVKRLKKELESKFKGSSIPDGVGSLAMEMPFVQTDYPIEDNPIIYLKKQTQPMVVDGGRAEQTEWPPSPLPTPTSAVDQPQTKLPPLPSTTLLDGEFFDVVVTCINSPIDFYVQKSENEKLLQQLEDELRTYSFWNVSKAVPAHVVPNTLYAYLWKDEGERRNYWCRVLVVSCSDQIVDVMFPDYGDTKILPCKDLKTLPSQFYQLPFQAVQCCLHGVSDTSEAASLKFIELADQEPCVAQVMNSSGHRCSLELIPTNAEPGAETINSTILKLSQPISSLKPLLPMPGHTMVAVKLTDVDEDGIVSVQLVGPGLTYLDQLLTEINNPSSKIRKEGKPMGFVTQRSVGYVCCVPFVDGTWYRAQIKKLISLKKVLVEYVDFGNEEEVDLNTTTLVLPSQSDELFSLPPQAVKCTMHGLPPVGGSWTENASEALSEFIDSGELLLQVVKVPSDGGLPSVKLFWSASEEEEEQEGGVGGQHCIGDYLLSLGVFNLPPKSASEPVESKAYPLSNMKIVVTGSEEIRSRKVIVEQGSLSGTNPPGAHHEPVERPHKGPAMTPPPSYQASVENNVSPPHSHSSSNLSQNTAPSVTDTIDSGIQSLQITSYTVTESPGSSPPQATAKSLMSASSSHKKSPPQAIPHSPPPLYDITSSPICSPPPQSGVSTPRQASPRASLLKVPPAVTPPTTPISSPPVLSPSCGPGMKRRLFGKEPSILQVKVTCVRSPDHFTVQVDSDHAQLERLQQMMGSMVEGSVVLQEPVTTGKLYCAQFTDQKWYRCEVTELLPNETVRVVFVDYGDEAVLRTTALHVLPQSVSDFPIYGVTCILGGAVPLEGKWSDPAIKYFRERVLEKSFFALFKERTSASYTVALTDTSLVAQDLVLRGFAKQPSA